LKGFKKLISIAEKSKLCIRLDILKCTKRRPACMESFVYNSLQKHY